MIALPNAMSHGLGGGAGATVGAFDGRSAANAGAAAETASAATTDNTTFFMESAPFNSIGLRVSADPLLPAAALAHRTLKVPDRPGRVATLQCGKFDL
jgi:hypothetical protein